MVSLPWEQGGRAVALLGEPHTGKSTPAGAFVRSGHGFLADHIVALVPGPDGELMVRPAFPQFKLWSDTCFCALLQRRGVSRRGQSWFVPSRTVWREAGAIEVDSSWPPPLTKKCPVTPKLQMTAVRKFPESKRLPEYRFLVRDLN